jgi:sugar/nucleoside kinase (ribokinase family)
MRSWGAGGRVSTKSWWDEDGLLRGVSLLVLSEEDVAFDEASILRYARMVPIVVATRGRNGATVYLGDGGRHFAAYRASEVDLTGAGDVFATAFLVRLRETGDPFLAAPFANCAASLSIEGMGTSAIPTRREIEDRLRSGRLVPAEERGNG